MTDDEQTKLNEIERESRGSLSALTLADRDFLLALARRESARADAAERAASIVPTFLQDRAADTDWLAARDVVLIDEAAKMAARECVAIIEADNGTLRVTAAPAIAARFRLSDASGQTLTQAVAAECAELVEREVRAAGSHDTPGIRAIVAIPARFGLASQIPVGDPDVPLVDADTRTVADVIQERRGTGGACCERFANQQGCDCLEQARERERERDRADSRRSDHYFARQPRRRD